MRNMRSLWFWLWPDCWWPMGWNESYCNCFSPGIFAHGSLWFTQSGAIEKKHLVDERAHYRTARLVGAGRKAVVSQITTLYNYVKLKKQIRLHSMSTLEADGHQQQTVYIRFHFCQPRSESRGCSGLRLPQIGFVNTNQCLNASLL